MGCGSSSPLKIGKPSDHAQSDEHRASLSRPVLHPRGVTYTPEKSKFTISLLGNQLRLPGGQKGNASLLKRKVIGMYFSAHWCPPCRAFTPILSSRYETLKKHHDVEIIFISSDQTEAEFIAYHNTMSFPAFPYDRRNIKIALSTIFQVRGIPALIFVDAQTGDIITKDGRAGINSPTFVESFPYNDAYVHEQNRRAALLARQAPAPRKVLLPIAPPAEREETQNSPGAAA
jgi:nucleoredoxin